MRTIVRVEPGKAPVVALESTVVVHGLPSPLNVQTAVDMEREIERFGAVPATIGVVDGNVIVGLERSEMERMVREGSFKTGVREIPYVVAEKLNGDTTVSATVRIASAVGIDVFVTGGIGGVHRGVFDISQDLVELSRTSIVVVSAGAKSILDLEKTVEILETLGVVVVGFKTNEFPAFYSRSSSIRLNMSVETVEEISDIFVQMRRMNYEGALLVVNPVPEEYEIPREDLEDMIERARREAERVGVRGKELTPFLLKKLGELSDGRTIDTNVQLLLNNARLGAQIAVELFRRIGRDVHIPD